MKKTATFETSTNQEALDAIAEMIDLSFDQSDPDLTSKAFEWCELLETRSLTLKQRAVLDYYRANAWENRRHQRSADHHEIWAWDQEELQQQIFFLRRALGNPAYKELHVVRRCQIRTNLANQLNTVGRFIEAQALWSKALEDQPEFWMARGNRGHGLMYYANVLYDPGHAAVFALSAHSDFNKAIRDIDQHPQHGDVSVRLAFVTCRDAIARQFDLDKIRQTYRPTGFGIGDQEDERSYRRWCLDEVLFLNPLNDLGSHPIAARDVLTLPNFVTATSEPPVFTGFFNQLKQEFVSARWLCFEGISEHNVHMSDKNVLLYNTFDSPAFGLAVEKVKIAFRMSYSLLDKIAYFLNRYMNLGIPEKKVSFRTIWRDKDSAPIREQLSSSENWPFRGLYWLSKDLFEKEYKDVAEPDAQELSDLRNHLEHKYVKVCETQTLESSRDGAESAFFLDDFAHIVSRDTIERRALHVLRLARSALLYLSLGMHKEEKRRCSEKPGALYGSVVLDQWNDEWKRRW